MSFDSAISTRSTRGFDRFLRCAAFASVVLFIVSGCGSNQGSDHGQGTTLAPKSPRLGTALDGSITVSAAASLTDVFAEIAAGFESANPGVVVTTNFGSSGALATQVDQGAPADVVAFADTGPMERLGSAQLLAAPAQVFATNRLVIVTKPGNPEGIVGLADLPDVGVVATCVDTAPCGALAEASIAKARVTIAESNMHRGPDARATLAAVVEGDADAGIVYVTDVAAVNRNGVKRAEMIVIPEEFNGSAEYPIAVVADTKNPGVANAFVRYVLSDAGRTVLQDHGFALP